MARTALLLTTVSLVLATSCRPTPRDWEGQIDEPEELLTIDHMIDILIDIHLAEGDAQEKALAPEKQRELLSNHYGSICELHGVSMQQIRISYDYYIQKPLTMNVIYEGVINGLKKIEGELEAR